MKKDKPSLHEQIQEALPVLANVSDLRLCSFEKDARRLLACEAVLIGILKVEHDPELGPHFLFAFGWPRDKGAPPDFWRNY